MAKHGTPMVNPGTHTDGGEAGTQMMVNQGAENESKTLSYKGICKEKMPPYGLDQNGCF